MMNRYERQERFFGAEGQRKLKQTRISVVGVGGLGCIVSQQLSLLGVGEITLIDSEELTDTDRNRNVYAYSSDSVPGTSKLDIAERYVKLSNENIKINKVYDSFVSERAFGYIKNSTHVFGCLDNEGSRLILNELCSAYELKYLDLASDIPVDSPGEFGGRILINWDGDGCLYCLDQLDLKEAQEDLSTEDEKKDNERIYGVNLELLNRSGPSVVSLNGVVASLAVTEFLMGVTEIRKPVRLLNYRGSRGIVNNSNDVPHTNCYYCKGIRGIKEKADIQRYIKNKVKTSKII